MRKHARRGYGIAPLGGIAASHGLREAVKSDRGRRWIDLGIYSSAIAAFALWAWQFGPTFLADTLANPGAAAQSGSALSDFYGYHLALEFFGGAAMFCAAKHMLMAGARLIAIRSETAQILEDTMASEGDIELALAARQDTVAAAPTIYEDAMRAFQDHCVVRVEVVKKLFEAESASDGLRLLAELRTKFLNTSEGDAYHV